MAAFLGDLTVLTLAGLAAAMWLYPWSDSPAASDVRDLLTTPLVMITVALACLAAQRAWDARVLGHGADEFRRLARSFTASIAIMAVGGFMFENGRANGQQWLFVVLPVAGFAASALRYGMRKFVHRRRVAGGCLRSVLLVGSGEPVRELIRRQGAATLAGWRIDAICATGSADSHGTDVDGVPIVGTEDDIVDLVLRGGYDAVALLPSNRWSGDRTRRLAWELESAGTHLLMAPILMSVAGPRVHLTPVAGVPLMQLSQPTFSGPARVLKQLMDRVLALLGLAVLAPLMVAIAVVIRATSPGPALYVQTRVGKGGRDFEMVKFRSMVAGADAMKQELVVDNDGAGPLFKIRRDPRVTRVGAFLRRYSLDELPQLFNVLGGSMSLVGPRPPLPTEVEAYGSDVRRRLLVTPGLTGLWQVTGRSDLSWTESVQQDLHYVENWSLTLDVFILWKTARAVLSGRGAY